MIIWKETPKLVLVQWEDATNLSTWHDKEEISEHWDGRPQICYNSGYLIGEDETGIYVAARKGQYNARDDAWGLIERLPRGMIIDVVLLEEGETV